MKSPRLRNGHLKGTIEPFRYLKPLTFNHSTNNFRAVCLFVCWFFNVMVLYLIYLFWFFFYDEFYSFNWLSIDLGHAGTRISSRFVYKLVWPGSWIECRARIYINFQITFFSCWFGVWKRIKLTNDQQRIKEVNGKHWKRQRTREREREIWSNGSMLFVDIFGIASIQSAGNICFLKPFRLPATISKTYRTKKQKNPVKCYKN